MPSFAGMTSSTALVNRTKRNTSRKENRLEDCRNCAARTAEHSGYAAAIQTNAAHVGALAESQDRRWPRRDFTIRGFHALGHCGFHPARPRAFLEGKRPARERALDAPDAVEVQHPRSRRSVEFRR